MDRFIFIRDICILILYILTSLLAVITNIPICRISLQRRKYSVIQSTYVPLSTINTFLFNLALADALAGLTISSQVVFCSKYFLETFSFSSYICILSKSIQILGYNTSTLTICVIAFDRYRIVKNPFKQYYRRKTFRIIFCTWFLSGLFSTSCLISMKADTYFNSYQKLISCKVFFPISTKYLSSFHMRKIRVFCLIFFFFLIPFLILTILCILTMRVIARRSIIGAQQFQTFEQSRTRSIRLLMVIIVVFTLSHLPINFLFIRDFFLSSSKISSSKQTNKCNDPTIFLSFYWLGISSCCHNPFIYGWFNRKYRRLIFNCCRVFNFF